MNFSDNKLDCVESGKEQIRNMSQFIKKRYSNFLDFDQKDWNQIKQNYQI